MERSISPDSIMMIKAAQTAGVTLAWDGYEAQLPQCGFGETGLCCRHCLQGPCRIDPFGMTGPELGICGANADTIVARGWRAHRRRPPSLGFAPQMPSFGVSEGIDAARPLQTVAAAQAGLAEAALGQLRLVAIPGEGHARRLRGLDHHDRIRADRAFHESISS